MLKHFPALPLQTDQALAETLAHSFDTPEPDDLGILPFNSVALGLFGFILSQAPMVEGRRQLGWVHTESGDLSDEAHAELLDLVGDSSNHYPVEAGATSYVIVRGETRQGLLVAIGFEEGIPAGGRCSIPFWDVFVYPYPANVG